MAQSKRLRDLKKIAEQAGCTITAIEQGRHLKLKLETSKGGTFQVTASPIPKDYHSDRNLLADIKKRARALEQEACTSC